MASNDSSSSLTLGPVVVTGGCGFIGSHTVKGLLGVEPHCQIHVLDINTSRNRVDGVRYHLCDISSSQQVEAVFAEVKPKTVFHIACPDSMVVAPEAFRRVNVDGTKNLLEAAHKHGVHAFVNTSTSSVIHDNVSDLIDADENLPVLQYPAQKRVYTLTKAEGEALVLAANRASGNNSMLTVSIRPATAFGEADTICMGKIVQTFRSGKGNVQFGDGKNEYDFIYISNLVDAHILAAQALLKDYGNPPGQVEGQSFHVTNDERVLFWDFQRAIGASIGIRVEKENIKVIPAKVGLLMASLIEWFTWVTSFGKKQPLVTWEAVRLTTITRTLNGDKAKRVLGYTPRVSIDEGLARAGKWFIEEQQKEEEAKKNV